MSIEQKIAELLAESRKAQEIQEEKVKPDGAESGKSDKATAQIGRAHV